MKLLRYIKKYAVIIVEVIYRLVCNCIPTDDKQVVFLSFHGKGYGKEIYNLLENEWKKSGFTRIVLNVDLKNSAAILFWIKMGFKNIDFSFQSNENETEKFYMLRLSKNI